MPRGQRNSQKPAQAQDAQASGQQDEAAKHHEVKEDPAHAEFAADSGSQPGELAEGFKEPGPAVKRIKTIPMVRTEDGKPADVHPDEVEHMKLHGWEMKE